MSLVLVLLALLAPVITETQILDKVKRKVKKKVEKVIEEKETAHGKKDSLPNQEKPTAKQEEGSQGPALVWSKYDFVPGDKIIFEDALSGEENGEFPSRWDLMRGNVEVAQFDGENVIMFGDGASTIVPYT